MRRLGIPWVLAPALLAGCVAHPERAKRGTLAELRDVRPDLQEASVDQGLEQAMQGYRRFLDETPETAMTPEAMRRLADLQIEKQFGLRATESDQDFERRTTAESAVLSGGDDGALPVGAVAADADPAGPLEAIAIYDRLLTDYPSYEHIDKVLYQKARAYDELGRTEQALETMQRLIRANPHSGHHDEVQFRRGEYFFTRGRHHDAESAYAAIIGRGTDSSYYEHALYKLGWTLYKREFYEEALHKYVALLDHRVSIGDDFDQTHTEEDERRVADTFRVISLSFSNLGGAKAVREYFSTFENRTYENRVYSNLGGYYLAKLRYDDAAKAYRAFAELYPFHRAAPHFSMRVVETFTEGGFPKLVLESKREFASRYGLHAEYWRHFTPEDSPEVLAYLKSNLKDLATHYHARYQGTEEAHEKLAHYREALQWYGDYLESFPTDADSPPINYRLADLHLEHEDFGEAARQYERTAYDYAPHDQSAAAGYAAVYAYREQLKVANEKLLNAVKHDTVASSLRFADAFPDHEHAAAILGAAADDMYETQDYPTAIASAQRVIDTYPDAAVAIRRAAWVVVAHGSFELAAYPQAEQAYLQVLAFAPEDDESRAALVDNLAASIYKQGELANDAQDYRAAADHFLRIRSATPTSAIRATAEYDAGAALMQLESWIEASEVLEAFRSAYPEHELRLEATQQIAFARRENGQLSRAADEYDRLASESEDPALRSEALLVAGDLYEQSDAGDRALEVYTRYVDEFPRPVEMALETRFKIAQIHKSAHDELPYHEELAEIVHIDAEAGSERTGRTRTLAARSALVLAEQPYREFVAVKLVQPFEISLHKKQQQMDVVTEAMGRLVEYEIAEVTAAATYYMAETYFDFSRALAESERPADLLPANLAEYELALDEEAFPFEEKAIDFHEKNVELVQAGVFNDWTEKSLGKLAELVPGRYAKNEMSGDFRGAIDRYEYRLPVSQVSDPTSDSAATSPPGEPARTMQPARPATDDEQVGYESSQ